MTLDTTQPVQQEWEALEAVQHYLPAELWQSITQRATELQRISQAEPSAIQVEPATQSAPRPLVKRLGTTPQPLSDLFVVN